MIIRYLINILLLLASILLVACSEKETDGTIENPVFPTKIDITAKANDTLDLKFESSGTWRLESNKLWVRFLREVINEPDNTMSYQELSIEKGEEGFQNIKVVIMREGNRFDESDLAHLKLYVGNDSQVIYEITREPKCRFMDVMAYTVTSPFKYEKVDKIIIDTNNAGNIRVRKFGLAANYDWKIIDCPEWIDQPLRNITGLSGAIVTSANDNSLIISGKNQAYAVDGEIIIAPRTDLTNVSKWVRVPIEFMGMSPVKLEVKGLSKSEGVTFFPNGFLATSSLSQGLAPSPSDSRELDFNFWTRDMDYKLEIVRYNHLLNKAEVMDINSIDCWLNISINDAKSGDAVLSVKDSDEDNHSEKDKELYLFLLPKKFANINYNYDADFNKGIPTLYGRQFKIIKKTDRGFKIVNSISKEVIWGEKVNDINYSNMYGTEEIYKVVITKDFWDVNRANVLITGNLWDGENYTPIPNTWAKSTEVIANGFTLRSRATYDKLPDSELFIEFKTLDGLKTDRVLILSKK